MAEIGTKLHEARMRARIDLSEVEIQTKIRSKYLRALENEEWSLLPGPTYVKSFLRTYAEFLGLDGSLIVNEYRLENEREGNVHAAITPGSAERKQRRANSKRGRNRVVLTICALVALAIGLGILGRTDNPDIVVVETVTTKSHSSEAANTSPAVKTQPRSFGLRIIPTAPVWVCLEDGSGQVLVDSQILSPGEDQPHFRAKSFLLELGNTHLQLRIDGRKLKLPDSSGPVNYKLTAAGVKRLTASDRNRATCKAGTKATTATVQGSSEH